MARQRQPPMPKPAQMPRKLSECFMAMEGYRIENTEWRIAGGNLTDLCGGIDFLAISQDAIIGVQASAHDDTIGHQTKIENTERMNIWRECRATKTWIIGWWPKPDDDDAYHGRILHWNQAYKRWDESRVFVTKGKFLQWQADESARRAAERKKKDLIKFEKLKKKFEPTEPASS